MLLKTGPIMLEIQLCQKKIKQWF